MRKSVFIALVFLIQAFAHAEVEVEPKALDTSILGRASVRIGNGSCSGSVFWKGATYSYAMTAEHCIGSIHSSVVVQFVSGKETNGLVIAKDADLDIAIIKLWSKHVMDAVPPVRNINHTDLSEYVGVGFTGGVGPKLKRLTSLGPSGSGAGERNQFEINSGPFSYGDSGGGVYWNSSKGWMQAGVISEFGDRTGRLKCSSPRQIVQFLSGNADKFEGCNGWWCEPNFDISGRPKDLRNDDDITKAIVALRNKISVLENSFGDLKGDRGPVGPPRTITIIFQDSAGNQLRAPIAIPPDKKIVRVPIERFVRGK